MFGRQVVSAGERGEHGDHGQDGRQGERGHVGPQGAPGRDAEGVTGATGPRGRTGRTSLTKPQIVVYLLLVAGLAVGGFRQAAMLDRVDELEGRVDRIERAR